MGAVILNDRGDVLLQQRDDRAPSFRRCWTLFGGMVEPDESPVEAILRELREEISLDLATVVLIRLFKIYQQPDSVTQLIYEVCIEAEFASLSLKEGRAMRFVKTAELPGLKFAFNIESVLEDYLSFENATGGIAA